MDNAFGVSFSVGGEDQAFSDDWRGEAIRYLREVADLIEAGLLNPGESVNLRDVNGNTIGSATVLK